MFKPLKKTVFSKLLILFSLCAVSSPGVSGFAKLSTSVESLLNDPKAIKINMLAQSEEILFNSIDLKHMVYFKNGIYGFTIYYVKAGKDQVLVDYSDQQFTQEIHTTRAVILIISKLKVDKPLEIVGDELISIFK